MKTLYIDRFLKLKSSIKFLELKLFPNTKEVTESMGAWFAIKRAVEGTGIDQKSNCIVYVVGDGHVPRTGALIACMTKWGVVSIDPVMRLREYGIKRLGPIQERAENLSFDCEGKIAFVVHVHSHAKLSDSIEMLQSYKELYVINIPCCVPSDINIEPIGKYTDECILSKKNEVEIYKIKGIWG